MEKLDRNVFQIPEYEYFEMGGKYSGCKRGSKFDDYSFRITPTKEDITVQIWYDTRCFELSELVTEKVFAQSRDGHREMIAWIEEQYWVWRQEHIPKSNKLGYYAERPYIPDWVLEAWVRLGIRDSYEPEDYQPLDPKLSQIAKEYKPARK
ncbi:MAG: hypothetical protein IJ007_07620 [Oscillospiraceae bacterium]|nr:hypothetical protein [Oscillospiraceae bacterium]